MTVAVHREDRPQDECPPTLTTGDPESMQSSEPVTTDIPIRWQNPLVVGGRAGRTRRNRFSPTIVKNLAQNGPSRFAPNPFAFFAMKAKRTLPAVTTGHQPRRRSGMSQKKERDAIDAALERLIGDDGFRPQGIFGTRKPT
jgi:hypothetical protein